MEALSAPILRYDKYGGLLPGSEEEAAGLLDAYFEAQLDQAAAQTCSATGERQRLSAE
jgi:hypothetical protein